MSKLEVDSYDKESVNEYEIYNDIWLGKTDKYESKLNYLVSIAKKEEWNFSDSQYRKENKGYPILENYIAFTYDRLKHEGKISYSDDGNNMCFNTGLQTDHDEDIFFFCDLNKKENAKQKWFFVKFCKQSGRELSQFNPLPTIANYFDNPADLLLDQRLLPIRINYDHIISDNKSRFEELVSYKDHLLRNALESAVKQAERRVVRNYKVAIPQFYTNKQTGKSKIQLLMPLCIDDKSKVDLALVVEKESNAYIAKTILPLDWAYMNSRRIARPDSEWIDIMFKNN